MRCTLFAVAGAAACIAGSAGAQGVALSRNAPGDFELATGRTATIAFSVRNTTSSPLLVAPVIRAPSGWTVVAGAVSFAIGASGQDLWIVGLSIPQSAAAGRYRVDLALESPAGVVRDSLHVIVGRSRGLETYVSARPAYTLKAGSYSAQFSVRNTGNGPARVRLYAHSAQGVAKLATPAVVAIAPGSVAPVDVKVALSGNEDRASDDVLDLRVVDEVDTTITAESSVKVAIVAKPQRFAGRYHSINALLRGRLVGKGTGVAPFEISGGGRLHENSGALVDFYCRGPVSGYSSVGERNECRGSLRGDNYSLRIGDYAYSISSLSTTGEPGIGAAVDLSRAGIRGGAFGQRFRWNPVGGTELGAYVALQSSPRSPNRLALNFVTRSLAPVAGNVATLDASLGFGPLGVLSAEYAASRGDSRTGRAGSVRVSRDSERARYEAGYQSASPAFAGLQRGTAYRFLSGSVDPVRLVSLHASLNDYDATRRLAAVGSPNEHLTSGLAGATFFQRFTVDAVAMNRSRAGGVGGRVTHRGVRVSAAQQLGFITLAGDVERGLARDDILATQQGYSRFTFSPRISLGGQGLGFYYSFDDGRSAIGESGGAVAIGAGGSLRLPGGTNLSFNALRVRPRVPGDVYRLQLDARGSHTLANGHTLGARVHLLNGIAPSLERQRGNTVFFEYGLPLRVPVAAVKTAGRVEGRVVDAVTGRGIPSALVALGGKAALTNANGQVRFWGLEPGEHPLLVGDDRTASGSVLSGDSRVTVKAEMRAVARFEVALTPGARVTASVRRFVAARVDISGAGADSLADAGAMEHVMVRLAGARDTLYQVTAQDGVADFGDVAPGTWTMSVMDAELGEFEELKPAALDLGLAAGGRSRTEFRIVPASRKVRILDDSGDAQSETLVVRRLQN